MLSHHQKGIALAFSATFLVSLFPLSFRELGRLHEPFLCTLALFIVSFFTASIPIVIKPSRLKLSVKGYALIVAIAAASLVGNWSYIQSLQLLEPAISSTIQRVELIFVAVFGAIFFAEKITLTIVVSIIFSLIGLFFLQGAEFVINDYLFEAILITLLSSLAFALMLLFSKFIMRHTGVFTMNFYRLLVAVCFLLLVLDAEKLQELSWYAWLLTTISALCGPSGARFLITYSLNYISMSTALLCAMAAPVLTACWQWLFWDTVLSSTELVGAGMILMGVLFTLLRKQ